MDLFPILWVLNDVAIMVAVAGVMMMVFRGPGPVGPTRDEWTGWATAVDEDPPLERLLAELARRASLEAGRP